MVKVSIFNYGAGNLFSIQTALRKEGVEASATKTGAGLKDADAIVLPGVGSFDQATSVLPMRLVRDTIERGTPVLGVCLGLQLFFESSEEGRSKGFAFFGGRVKRFSPSATIKVPQIGWNTITVGQGDTDLLADLPSDPWVYYVNSYYPDAKGEYVLATSRYGVEFPAVVADRNVYGTQFHPEKSGPTGRAILRNFLAIVKK